MSIDLYGLIRRRKPDKGRTQLSPRSRVELVEWTALKASEPAILVLDTNVYIGRAAGRLPPELREIIDQGLLFHCAVALSELAVGVANADPAHAGWRKLRDHYAEVFAAIPATRLLTPDAQVWAEAGMLAGALARTQGYQPHQRKACLNDALIFLTAAKAGLPVLTSDRDEVDLIQQLAPEGRFIHY